MKEDFLVELGSSLGQDLRRGFTTTGPHRDAVSFLIGNRDASRFGSSGQQRSIILALKVSELQLFYKQKGELPVLLIDDIDTELDSMRIMKAVELAGSGVQVVVTSNKPELLGYIKNVEKIIKLKNGAVVQ